MNIQKDSENLHKKVLALATTDITDKYMQK